MATGDSRWVSIGPKDTVVFSSHPIPGNEAAVARVRSGLARQGATIVHSGQVDVHTTGHGKQQELLLLPDQILSSEETKTSSPCIELSKSARDIY